MRWKHPPVIKICEALGAMADGRVEVSGNSAKVYSSSRNKFYDVACDPASNSIMANDNGSYWQGYLGYPSIAYLLKIGALEYKPSMGELLKGIAWKDVNQKFKNDFDKTLDHILSPLSDSERQKLMDYVGELSLRIKELDLNLLGKKTLPPEGY